MVISNERNNTKNGYRFVLAVSPTRMLYQSIGNRRKSATYMKFIENEIGNNNDICDHLLFAQIQNTFCQQYVHFYRFPLAVRTRQSDLKIDAEMFCRSLALARVKCLQIKIPLAVDSAAMVLNGKIIIIIDVS